MHCPKCGEDIALGRDICDKCQTKMNQWVDETLKSPGSLTLPEGQPLPRDQDVSGPYWLLPLLLGIVGGVIAAAILAARFKPSWWAYVVLGAIVTLVEWIIWALYAFSRGV
jgi:hypothetical protein